AGGLVDMTDLCDWKQRDQGKFYPQSEAATREGSRWLGLPHCVTPALINYRKSWFAEAGATAPPKNLDEYRKLGAVLKKKGKPFGQTLGHTVNDAPGWSYPLTWTFGGAETDKTGRKVVLNSKNTIEAVKWMTAFWKEACDEGGLPGTTRPTTALFTRARSLPPSMAEASTCWRAAGPTSRTRRASPSGPTSGTSAIPTAPTAPRRRTT